MSDKCKTVIHGDWGRWHQCRNSAKREGYCGMHHPDAVKARQEKSTKLYEENREKSDSYRLKKALATIATLTEQVDALAEGARHVLTLCKDVPDMLTKYPEDSNLVALINIKKVAKQMQKYAAKPKEAE